MTSSPLIDYTIPVLVFAATCYILLRLLLGKKPFARMEVKQLAQSLSDWPESSAAYFKGVQARLKTFAGTGQLGLFANGQLTPEYQRTPSTPEPRLPEMARAALELLERNQTGFFLMAEGSLIDSGNHAGNIDYLVGEMAAFDESVKVVLDWIAAKPDRKQHTLLMVLPDHETGALAIHGTEKPGLEALGYFWPAYSWRVPPEPETHHTGGDIVFWVQGPGSEVLARPIENTFVYDVIKALLRS